MNDKELLVIMSEKHTELETETKKLINSGQYMLLPLELQKRITETLIVGKAAISELTKKVDSL